MAGYGLIDAYVESLRGRVRWRHDIEALAAEVTDHLYSTAERFEAAGIDPVLAQRAALERFGDPAIVARAYAASPNGGLAVPTESTKAAGRLAIASAALWLAVVGFWLLAGMLEPRYELQTGVASIAYAAGAVALLGATLSMVAAMMGLHRRHGGLGVVGVGGMVLASAGVIGGLLAWVFAGWGTLTVAGTLAFGAALWRRNLAPRFPVALMAGGPVIGVVAWALVRSATGPLDLTGLWGVHWVENQVGVTIGVVILAVGLLGLGRWLRSEEPAILGTPGQPIVA